MGNNSLNGIKYMRFTIFFVCLLLSTYMGVSEYFLVVTFGILYLFFGKKTRSVKIKKTGYSFFVICYFLSTILGMTLGYTEIINFLKLINLFLFLPYICIHLMPNSVQAIAKEIANFKIFIVISAIYGFAESLLKENLIVNLVKIDASSWIEKMNAAINYQPSSFYLHYSFYSCVLLIGLVLILRYPFKKRTINFLSICLLVEQLIVSQSRICWIAFVAYILYFAFDYLVYTKRIARKQMLRLLTVLFLIMIFIFLEHRYVVAILNIVENRFHVIKQYGMADGSVGQRIGTLMNWPKYFMEYPLQAIWGTGYRSIGNLFLAKYSYFKGFVTADNQYLTLLVEAGITGTICFLLFIAKLWANNRRDDISLIFKDVLLIMLILSLTFGVLGTTFIAALPFWFYSLYTKTTYYNDKCGEGE